jgi:hypothetical protein
VTPAEVRFNAGIGEFLERLGHSDGLLGVVGLEASIAVGGHQRGHEAGFGLLALLDEADVFEVGKNGRGIVGVVSASVGMAIGTEEMRPGCYSLRKAVQRGTSSRRPRVWSSCSGLV